MYIKAMLVVLMVAVALNGCTKNDAPDRNPTQAPQTTSDATFSPAWTRSGLPAPQSAPALTTHTLVPAQAIQIVQTSIDPSWQPIVARSADTSATIEKTPRSSLEVDEISAARTAAWWSAGAVFRWNEIARDLTARWRLNSSHSSRLFAALAVAQHDAALLSLKQSKDSLGEAPKRVLDVANGLVERKNSVSQEAAIAYASVIVLEEFFGKDSRFLRQNAWAHTASRVWIGANDDSEIDAGRSVGVQVAQQVVAHLRNDGSDTADEPRATKRSGRWFSPIQTLPGWSGVTPWVMDSSDQFRAPPPPAIDSPEFEAALEEIRAFSAQRSAEQYAVAWFWNLSVGGISVPGMWDQIALEYAHAMQWPEIKTARLLAVLNMAMFDACIASWETKYFYLVPRPSMVAPDIDEPLGLPAHPSYTSAHSAFSGAAEVVLSAAFPEAGQELHRLAEEASASRYYGGIHYRFDGEQGLIQGRKIAALALQKFPL